MTFMLTNTTTYEAVNCSRCGCEFALTEEHLKQLRKSHETFWCPNGHARAYVGETAEQKLRNDLQRERDRHYETRTSMQHEKRRAAAARGQVTKLKRRAANGVCPCCSRTFANLARHMASKHPEFEETK